MKYYYTSPKYDDEKGEWVDVDLFHVDDLTEEQEREKRLEKRVISMVMTPCRGGIDDTLTITSLEGYIPNFEYSGQDFSRLLRRLKLVKQDIDRFMAQYQELIPKEPGEPGVLRGVMLPIKHRVENE